MGSILSPCIACARHIMTSETACPFCGAAVPDGFGAERRDENVLARSALTRAALLFTGATTVAACAIWTGEQSVEYGPGAIEFEDSGQPVYNENEGGPTVLYGPAPFVDAGADAAEGGASEDASDDAGSDGSSDGAGGAADSGDGGDDAAG
jgi:hypothetical protein